jgi:hypothetical protein
MTQLSTLLTNRFLRSMTQTVQLRHNQRDFRFVVGEEVALWTGGSRYSVALDDQAFAEAVFYALQHPTDYPPVEGGVVPGDALAIVVDVELPNPAAAVRGALRAFESLELSQIDVIVAETASETTRQSIRDVLPDGVSLTIHSGKSRDDLRYLAANEAADPIYLNRRVVDADLVIPISVARRIDPLMAGSAANIVFPALSDHRSQARARIQAADVHASAKLARRKSADDEATRVGWLLGLQWMVDVEVTADGQPANVRVGTAETIAAMNDDSSGTQEAAFAADVVVACVDGDQQQQTLANLLRAALVARSHANPDASIVLVSDLADLGSVADTDFDDQDSEEQEQEARNARRGEEANDEADELTAESPSLDLANSVSTEDHARQLLFELINDLDSSYRFLLVSNCDDEAVEAFGFGVIDDEQALQRLVNAQGSCVVLRTAQLAATRSVHAAHATASPKTKGKAEMKSSVGARQSQRAASDDA